MPAWIHVPRATGRLRAADLGLVINTADPYSVQVGRFYAEARRLSREQVLELALPVRPSLSEAEFGVLSEAIHGRFGAAGQGPVQALALAWREPYAVGCHALTGALALGLDDALCRHSCAPSRPSPYFNSASAQPASDHGLRPSMLLAAPDVEAAIALVRRGVAADATLGRRGAPPVVAHLAVTDDRARSARLRLYPPSGLLRRAGVRVRAGVQRPPAPDDRVLLCQTGAVRVEGLEQVRFVPGALADHLTSFGGWLAGGRGQMSALAWIKAGATASYGTVSEPCNHPQKFPHPQVLLLHYLQGCTAIEAYWKSVAWPQQGLFIGEPLAAPFAARP